MDYLQANGNQLIFPLDGELDSFGLLEYYKYYTNDKYAEAHIEPFSRRCKNLVYGR